MERFRFKGSDLLQGRLSWSGSTFQLNLLVWTQVGILSESIVIWRRESIVILAEILDFVFGFMVVVVEWRRWRKCERLIFVDAGIWVFIFARVSKKGAWGVSELIFPVRALQRWINLLNWASWDDLVFSSGDLDQDSIELGSLLGYWHPEAGSKLVCSLPPCGPP